MPNAQPRTVRHAMRPLALAIATLTSGTALAQGSGLVLDEIIVTAQKQVQTVRDTPIAITAVSGEDFRDVAGFQFSDLSKMTAGLSVEGGDFDTNIVMRGLGTNLTGNVTDRVTTYVDGAFYISDSALHIAQFDLERFEVLRGPQGTLYGKASPAGAIVIHTRNPNLMQMDGYVEGSYTQRGGSNTQFGVSLPLIEGVLGVRVAGVYDNNRASDVRNIPNRTSASADARGGRFTVLFDPNSTYTSRLSYQYIELDRDFFQVIEGCGIYGCYRASDRKSLEDFKGQAVVRNEHVIWENTLSLPNNHELTSITFYQKNLRRRFRDDDALPVDERLQAVNPAQVGKAWNQEIRLSSSGNDFWDYMFGVFYLNQASNTQVEVSQNRLRNFGPMFGGIQPFGVDLDIEADLGSEDWALFTHNTLYLGERTRLTLGARWNRDSRRGIQPVTRVTTLPSPLPPQIVEIDAIPLDKKKRTFEAWTGTIKLQHEITDTMMGYVAYDRGFRAGSSNISVTGNLPSEFVNFDAEKSNAFEAGLKMELDGGRGELNIALYYQEYKDFQFLTQDILINNAGTVESLNEYVTNADEVVSKGIELEGRYLLSANWGVFGSIAYNDTKFEKFKDAPCNIPGETPPLDGVNICNLKGKRLGDQGNWSISLSSEYSLPLVNSGNEWYLRGLFNYESFRVDPGFNEKLAGYGTWDFFTGLRAGDGTWDVKLWVKNAFDKLGRTGYEDRGQIFNNTAAIGQLSGPAELETGYRVVSVNDPRTIGVTASYRF